MEKLKYKIWIRFCVSGLMPEEHECRFFRIEAGSVLRLYIESDCSTKSINFPLTHILKYDVEIIEG